MRYANINKSELRRTAKSNNNKQKLHQKLYVRFKKQNFTTRSTLRQKKLKLKKTSL